jgi:hypothetical protein
MEAEALCENPFRTGTTDQPEEQIALSSSVCTCVFFYYEAEEKVHCLILCWVTDYPDWSLSWYSSPCI